MPPVSKAQKKFMAMCAHNPPKGAKCPPKKVAKEFLGPVKRGGK